MLLLFLCPLWCCRMSTALCVCCGDECGRYKGWTLCGPHTNTNRFSRASVTYVCEMLEPPSRTMRSRIADHHWWRSAPRSAWNTTKGYVYARQFSVRGALYFIAVWATLVSLFNGIFNMAYSVRCLDPPYEYESRGLALYIWLIVFIGHVLPLILVSIIWWKATNVPESRWRRFYYGGAPDDACYYTGRCKGPCVNNYLNCRSPFWAHGCWWFVELIGVGIGGFFWSERVSGSARARLRWRRSGAASGPTARAAGGRTCPKTKSSRASSKRGRRGRASQRRSSTKRRSRRRRAPSNRARPAAGVEEPLRRRPTGRRRCRRWECSRSA